MERINFVPYISEILTKDFLKQYVNKIVPWGFNGLGYIVYKRCVSIETPILTADLTWIPAGEIPVGTEVIGFEEGPLDRKTKLGRPRKMEKSFITHNSTELAECVEIELEDGTLLYSTPDHSWLAHTGFMLEWVEAKDLVHKSHLDNSKDICYSLPKYCDVWGASKTYEAGYLAAAFDGEGSLDRKRSLSFTQTDNEMLKRVCEYLDLFSFKYSKVKKSQSLDNHGKSFESKKFCYQINIYGNDQVMRFLGIIRPKRLLSKFINRIDEMALRRRNRGDLYKKVIRVTHVGQKKIAVISTSSKTHITGGYPSHNTYARLTEDGFTEEWWQTIARCINGSQKIGARYTKEEAEKLYDLIFNLKCNFPGRMLWQLGTSTVDRFGGNSLLNCWFATMNEPKAFEFLFENLMLGGGVGFSVKREHINELPKIKKGVSIDHQATNDADLIVPDSREGWIRLLHYVLKSFFESGKSFTYSTILVRGAGEIIKGFGGTASGPRILMDGITNICSVCKSREGKKLRSIDVLDICNIIGSVVVAGNIRRSAEIALRDPDDYLFLRAKRWDLGNIPNWRAMSNNTVCCDDFNQISNDVWEGYVGNGEPYGLFNLPLCRKYGRIGEEISDDVDGVNPCGELPLMNYECCNLSELYLNNISSKEELITCSKLLYKTQKAIAAMKFIHDETNQVVRKNMRLGLSVTGICQSLDKISWLDDCYKQLRKFDEEWSKLNGYPKSIKLTTIKPSGTVSLLAGSTPGIHPAFSQFYTRRIRMASNDKLEIG